MRIRYPKGRRAAMAGLVAMALGVVPLATASGAASASGSASSARQARPVIDADWLYRQLFQLSTNNIYRVSGLDGPPQNPADPHNLPRNVNGWQEFYAQWKHEMTSTANMGSMARDIKVSDHYFRVQLSPRQADRLGISGNQMPYDSDVAEVTIPGNTCPGQRVLLAGHPDSTPAPGNRAAQLIDQGKFTDAMSALYSDNLGNGSPYDATSGIALGMSEFQALVHWWEKNNTWPTRTIKIGLFDAEETGLNGSFYYAANLIPQGPQGQYSMVANMDQNGIEYPAYHWGTDHYLNNLVGGGVGPWYTNINASPLKPNPVYPDGSAAWKAIQANMPAIQAFRAAMQQSVSTAFDVLGAKYNHQVPLENPLLIARAAQTNPVRSAPAYSGADQARYSPVQDDALGRTDQVPFVSQGIPGYGIVGAFDSNDTENPYPTNYKNKPPIFQYAGYDTLVDTIDHLNDFASGTPHGPQGVEQPSKELRRALELPATWTSYLVSQPAYGGADPRPSGPLAYFETTPVQPTGPTVHFDGSFSADTGSTGHLTYIWDFGDGTIGTGAKVTHTYTHPAFADVKLVVVDGHGKVSGYRQAVNVNAGPTAVAPATPACGRLQASDNSAIMSAARSAVPAAAPAAPGKAAATVPWTPSPWDYTDRKPFLSPKAK